MKALPRVTAALWLLACAGLAGPGTAPAEAVEVAERFQCQACHINRLREFRKKDVTTLVPYDPTPLEPTGRQNVVSTPAMCLSCHDGFVMDSRRKIWSNVHAAHPVGVVPSASIARPEVDGEPVYPLNEDGKIYCGSCHTGHAGVGAAEDAPTFMRVSGEDGQLCQGCHADKRRMLGTTHGRVRGVGKPGAPRDFSRGGLCDRCHVPHAGQSLALWARELGEGNTEADRLCRSCHKKDGVTLPAWTDHPRHVWAWSQALRAEMRPDSKVAMPVFDEAGHRAIIGRIGCPTCHDAHAPPGESEQAPSRFFLRLEDTNEFLCADCHAQQAPWRYRFFHSASTRGR